MSPVEGGGGGGDAITVTVADWVADPPPPVQVRVYVEVTVGVADCVPETVFAPDHVPDAVQDVASVEVHESVEDWPLVIDKGEVESEIVGAWGGGGADIPFIVDFPRVAKLHSALKFLAILLTSVI